MAVTIRSSTSTTASGTSITGTLPAGTTSGDIIVAFIGQRLRNITWAPPNGWAQVVSYYASSGPQTTITIFVLAASASEPGTYTFNSSGNAAAEIALVTITGTDIYNPVDTYTTTFDSATTTTPTTLSLTTRVDNEMLLCLYLSDTAATLTAAAGQTVQQATTRMMVSGAELITPPGATGTRAASGTSLKYVEVSLTIKPPVVYPFMWYQH